MDEGDFPKAVGHGFNLRGLPGDGTPASRFVRAFYLREYAIRNNKESTSSPEGAIKLATGILNNVYLVKGSIASSGKTDALEYTPWAVVKLPRQGLCMYRTAADMTWKKISISHLSLDQGSQEMTLPISMTELGIQDVTQNLVPQQTNV